MDKLNEACMWFSDILTLICTVSLLIYGGKHFFKKGKALYPQMVTLGMGCYAMSILYHLCQTLTYEEVAEGFTAAYLGKMGFFLFLFAANFGQMDGILDDGTAIFRKSRYIALAAPVACALLFIPCAVVEVPLNTKISTALVWVCAMLSSYFNLKHAVIDDCGFGFTKAIRPYNILAVITTFAELIQLVLWMYYDIDYGFVLIAISAVVFSVSATATMVRLKKGVDAWTI